MDLERKPYGTVVELVLSADDVLHHLGESAVLFRGCFVFFIKDHRKATTEARLHPLLRLQQKTLSRDLKNPDAFDGAQILRTQRE